MSFGVLQQQTMTDKKPNLRKSTPLNVFRVLTSREGLMPKSLTKPWRQTGCPGSAALSDIQTCDWEKASFQRTDVIAQWFNDCRKPED